MKHVAASLLALACLLIVPAVNAEIVDISVYKGQLRIIVPEKQARNSIAIRYRSKTREVVRVAIDNITLTNMRTKHVINMDDRSARLETLIDHEGYWNTDISYNDMALGQDEYRIDGRLSLHLIGSQRTHNFSAYLRPDSGIKRPEGSSIDWGLSE